MLDVAVIGVGRVGGAMARGAVAVYLRGEE